MAPERETTELRQMRQAEEAIRTAEQDIVRSIAVVGRFENALETLAQYHQANHFRENAIKIMRSPARKPPDAA